MFTEEVPADFKTSMPCKRRGCPLQSYFVDFSKQKKFFRYQCSDPKVWAGCNKTIAPNEIDPTKPKKPEPEAPKPVEDKPFKCPVDGCGFSAKNEFALNKHREYAHNQQEQPTQQ